MSTSQPSLGSPLQSAWPLSQATPQPPSVQVATWPGPAGHT